MTAAIPANVCTKHTKKSPVLITILNEHEHIKCIKDIQALINKYVKQY